MAHTLGQHSDQQYPALVEVKLPPLDDPLHAYASERTQVEQSDDGAAMQSKPMHIPNSILDELQDPEATPTAANAFPTTPPSSSSVRAASPAGSASEEDDGRANDLHIHDTETSGATLSPLPAHDVHIKLTQVSSIVDLQTRVCKAAARGDLKSLSSILHPLAAAGSSSQVDSTDEYPSSFALVNSPTASGQTPLLEAASHGHLHIVHHLLTEEGAVRDLEDTEGENAFLKASYNGHLDVMKYLAEGEDGTDVNAADRQGWTALHNAASRGYLEIVMWLAENCDTIDPRSIRGYTPLMNAASKGHLPIVRYLISKHFPDPFIRNAYNETAYDVAVATFELGIADILADYENQLWQDRHLQPQAGTSTSHVLPAALSTSKYNLLGMHITVPVVVYENQRLDLRWFSRTKRAIAGPLVSSNGVSHTSESVKFTSSALSRRDGHASSELPPSYDGLNASGKWLPVRRSDIKLPSILNPRQVRLPASIHTRPALQRGTSSRTSSGNPSTSLSSSCSSSPALSEAPEATEDAWFWLSSHFFVDSSPSNIDPEQGWQYATSFDAPDECWHSEPPIEVVRILSGEAPSKRSKWVRRRRWARIMRRRIDIPHWGFDDDPLSITSHEHEAERLPDRHSGDGVLPIARDYLERAQYFAGSHAGHYVQAIMPSPDKQIEDDRTSLRSARTVDTNVEDEGVEDGLADGRRAISRLETALQELQEGIAADQDEVRKLQAITLAEIFREKLDKLRLRYPGIEGINDDETESFRYPGADDDSELDETSSISTSLRSASLYSPVSHESRASFRRPSDTPSIPYGSACDRQLAGLHPSPSSTSIYRPDLSRQLSSNPDFRVPTSEEPRNSAAGVHIRRRTIFDGDHPTIHAQMSPSRPARWEPDESTSDCRRCHRKFTFFLRKHHCRKCGLVVCAHCSSHNDFLRSGEVVREVGSSDEFDPLYGIYHLEGGFYRTCDVCHGELRNAASMIDQDLLLAPNHFTSPRLGVSTVGLTASAHATATSSPTLAAYSQAVDNHLASSSTGGEFAVDQQGADGSQMERSTSDLSELGECPVCGTNLEDIPDTAEQEAHIQTCLESGTSSRVQDNRYLVFTLPESSPLVGTDCLICFESYEAGEQIGRLSCLCHFHRHCIANWLSRGKSCPVHAR